MAKHAADNGGFFGLFRKKKESYYDFTDTAKNTKKNDDYNGVYGDLKKDYTASNYSDIEDNGADIAYNNTTTLNNLSSSMESRLKSSEKDNESTQAVNTIEEVSVNNTFNGKLYQGNSGVASSSAENANQDYSNNTATHSSSVNDYTNNGYEEGKFVNDYEYSYQDYDEDEGIGFKKILIFIAIILVVAAVSFYLLFFKNGKEVDEDPVEEEVVQEEEKMISSLGGFIVLGKINIDSINVEQYILNATSDEALEKGVGKIENGASLSTNGNFCIAGHNREGVFKDLNSLVEGAEIKITDKDLNEMTYVVKEFREVAPDNLECILQDMTKEKITLVTCKEGATERYIVIAERK